MLCFKRIVYFFLVAPLLVACSTSSDVSPPPATATVAAAYARSTADHFGAVASVNPIATQAGLNAFAAGGNAVDAAVAVALTLGVVDSHNSGIGGGCFILVRTADGQVLAIDGREMAPAKATRDMYLRGGEVQSDLSKTGALAVGIPGSVAALYQLQQRAGKLDFAEVLLPAAELAERGFPIDATMAKRLQSTADKLRMFPASAEIFMAADGSVLSAGDVLRQHDLADSYRKLAEHGPHWFYEGEFAEKTARWMRANGGLITAEDFADYHTVPRQPVTSEFNGYTVYGFPPPSSGGVHVAQMLNIVENFDLAELSEAERTHVLAEAMRLAFADRAYWLGDADFVPVPKGLISPKYADKLAAKIDPQRAAVEVMHDVPPNADTALFGKHTTHIASADRQGNWVAITTTLNTSFGSKVVVPGTGVLLNNQMDDFVAQPGVPNAFGLVGAEANSIAPGKRPLSSMSPTIVEKDGEPVLTLGAAGGPTIITQVFQTLVRYLALGQSLREAVAGDRVHQQWRPDVLFVEPTLDPAVQQQLSERGHNLRDMGSFGGTQAIGIKQGHFQAVAEPRVIERNNALAPDAGQAQ